MRTGASSVLLLAVGLAGCPSFTTLKTARALDQGEFQLTAAPEVIGVAGSSNVVLPTVELAARYGIIDGFDLGLKLYILGVQLNSTIQLVRGGTFDLALAPAVGYFGGGVSSGSTSVGISAIPVNLPLLFGVNFGQGHQFVVGPALLPYFVLANTTSGSSNAGTSGLELYLGGTIGVSFKLGQLRIMPELDIFAPIYASASSGGTTVSGIGGAGAVIFQGAIGFSFGGDGFNKPRPSSGGPPPPPPPAPYGSPPPPPPTSAPYGSGAPPSAAPESPPPPLVQTPEPPPPPPPPGL